MLKWHGGKHYLASRIVELMPPHVHYVEPYAGGLAVLFAKPYEGVSEVVNDIHGELANFWSVLADPERFEVFRRVVEALPFSESLWKEAQAFPPASSPCPVERAAAFFVLCRQSLAGRMQSFSGITKTRTRRGMNGEVSAWLSAVEALPGVHQRLKRVLILNRDALDVIRGQDGPGTLYYCDPPYLQDTRSSPEVYAHEMTYAQHEDLLKTLKQCRGKVLLSGYPSALYDGELLGWTRHEFDLPNHAAGGGSKRRMQEVVWCNF